MLNPTVPANFPVSSMIDLKDGAFAEGVETGAPAVAYCGTNTRIAKAQRPPSDPGPLIRPRAPTVGQLVFNSGDFLDDGLASARPSIVRSQMRKRIIAPPTSLVIGELRSLG